MKKRGWKSEETLNRAKRELLERGIIQETRKGGFPNRAGLYAVTWLDIDDYTGLDFGPAGYERSAYLRSKPENRKSLATGIVATKGVIETVPVLERTR